VGDGEVGGGLKGVVLGGSIQRGTSPPTLHALNPTANTQPTSPRSPPPAPIRLLTYGQLLQRVHVRDAVHHGDEEVEARAEDLVEATQTLHNHRCALRHNGDAHIARRSDRHHHAVQGVGGERGGRRDVDKVTALYHCLSPTFKPHVQAPDTRSPPFFAEHAHLEAPP